MKIFDEFKAFIQRGNVIDMGVGIVIGASFQKIVNTFVNNLLMPPLGLLIGGADFSGFRLILKKGSENSPPIVLEYGLFINSLIDFVIIASAVFLLIKLVNALYRKKPIEKNKTLCPECLLEVPKKAKKCGHCTSKLS